MNLNTNMEMIGKRNPFQAEYTVGFTDEGKLLGISINYYIDCGCLSGN